MTYVFDANAMIVMVYDEAGVIGSTIVLMSHRHGSNPASF